MAVDTREKRFSMMSLGDSTGITMFEADGAVDADDRAHLLGMYSGIAKDAPVAPDPALKLMVRNTVQDIVRDVVRNPDDWKTT